MKQPAIVLTIVLICTLPILCMAADAPDEEYELFPSNTIGSILEHAPDYSFIQVGDQNYKVGNVFILSENDSQIPATSADIQENDIVQVIPGPATNNQFILAEKVIIYRGEQRDKIVQQLEQADIAVAVAAPENSGQTTKDKPSQKNQSAPDHIILENGIWHN